MSTVTTGPERSRRHPLFRMLTMLLAVLLGTASAISLSSLSAGAADESAADEGALTLAKTVSPTGGTLAPGTEFTYTIQVGCSDNDCVNASLVDAIPAEFAGFGFIDSQVTPTDGVTSTVTGCDDSTVSAGCAVQLDFGQTIPDGVGLIAGDQYTLTITLKVPADLPPDWDYNNTPITNTATATADNAETKEGSADVTIDVPITIDTETTKSWSPETEQFDPGAASTIDLTTKNTSNVPADSLVLQDPATAVDNATTLDPSNPFLNTDFTGFGDVTLPEGADQVQVDVYAWDAASGSYHWVTGAPGPPPASLPAGVDAADVAGIRTTFSSTTGATIVSDGTAGGISIDVAQRETNRDTDADLSDGWSQTNETSGTVNVPDQTPAEKDATADHSVTPFDISVDAGKSFDPVNIPAGTQSIGTVTGQNTSDGPLDSLTISDQNYFTDQLNFDGFTDAPTFPAGSETASVTYTYSDGTTSTVTFDKGETPPAPTPPPGAYTSGFAVTFDGPIDAGASASIPFGVTPASGYVTEDDSPKTSTNTVDVSGKSGDKTAEKDADADLNVYAPDIDIDFDKSILPDAEQSAVQPGGTVTVELPATPNTDSSYVDPTEVVIDDVAPKSHDDDDFWNAFNPTAIAPTQVPAGTTLNISYTTDDGDTYSLADWCDLPVTGATVFSCSIPEELQDQITGLRFDFTNPDGLANGGVLQPNITFEARSEKRYSDEPTSEPGGDPTVYGNGASAHGKGNAGGTDIDSDTKDADDDAAIVIPEDGTGPLIEGKRWTTPDFSADLASLPSQSGDQAGTVLDWGIATPGGSELRVSDPQVDDDGTPAAPVDTVFQAFDLVRIMPVATTQDPLMQWDYVSRVELYENGVWTTIPAPAAATIGWNDASGFLGYTLTDDERAATTGVRLTVLPNDAARTASTDPTRPAAGSGIASSTVARHFDLLWNLRNKLRTPVDGDDWARGSTDYNTNTPGLVNNHEHIDATVDGDPETADADDTIQLIDEPPGVAVTKTSQNDTIALPFPTDTEAGDYPTNDFTIDAHSTSATRASYVRVTDPVTCAENDVTACTSGPDEPNADPFTGYSFNPATSPFNSFTLTGLSFSYDASEVDPGASTVWLLHYADDGALSTTRTTITAAAAMTADQLADVFGVSVTYQGTDPATDGGSITAGNDLQMVMHTQVRKTIRTVSYQPVLPGTVTNEAFAQSYDPVLYPDGEGSTPNANAGADVILTGGQLDITASKSFSPQSLLEANRTDPVSVTLGATQGPLATVPTDQVTIEDTDQDFWNEFSLTGLGDVTLPDGADQVRVDVQRDGSSTWVEGTAAATAALPSGVVPGDVTGIRLVFNNADGSALSSTSPPQPWSASAVLQLQLREEGRDGSAIPFPSTISNTVTTNTHRTDGTENHYPDVNASADDDFTLDPGTFSLDVAKDPLNDVHTVAVGSVVPWTLTFTNTGTGLLTVPDLVDTLPDSLEWDGETPTYAGSDGGTLATAGITVTQDPENTLTFSWPDGGQKMRPGETFTITLGLSLKPGLLEGERATNQMVVDTDEQLEECTNDSGNGQGTIDGLEATQCGTTNYVSPVPGPAMLATKGVKGDVVDPLVSGAVDPADPDYVCEVQDDGYYHQPCVANTRMAGTDEWLLTQTNSGTVPYTSVTLVDPLPTPGDRLLATGADRLSEWRTVLDTGFGVDVDAPDGSTSVVEVTTDAQACVGTGDTTDWTGDARCTGNAWTALDDYSGDAEAITALRVTITFPEDQPLAPGGSISATLRTINEPASTETGDGMSTIVPLGQVFDYNQVGAEAVVVGGGEIAQAPTKVGVTPSTGSLEVVKRVTGADADRAPDRFEADVSCSVDGVVLDLGDQATLTLDAAGEYSARVDGIPVGAECTVVEAGDPGSYGEDSRTVDGSPVTIAVASSEGDEVPSAQVVTITNVYDEHPTPTGSLEVVKRVTGADADRAPDRFEADVSCSVDGVVLDLGDQATLTLDAAGEYSARVDGIPVGAECTVVEAGDPGSYGEDSRTVDGSPVTIAVASSEGDEVPSAQVVTITNVYDEHPTPPTPTPPAPTPPTPTPPAPTPPTPPAPTPPTPAPPSPTPVTPAPVTPTPPDDLAVTGADPLGPIAIGSGLLIAGLAVTLLVALRRRSRIRP